MPFDEQPIRHLQAELQELRSSTAVVVADLQLQLGETESRLMAANAGVSDAGAHAESSSATLSCMVRSCGLIPLIQHDCVIPV